MAHAFSRIESPSPSPPRRAVPDTGRPPSPARPAVHPLHLPDLVDLVFDRAPPAALVRMARVCRAWRQRVLSSYAHVFNASGDERTVTLQRARGGAVETLRGGELRLLAACRVVEFTAPGPAPDTRWLGAGAGAVHTVRFARAACSRAPGPTLALPHLPACVRRAVCDNFWPAVSAAPHASHCEGVTKLVVTYGPGFGAPCAPRAVAIDAIGDLQRALPRLRLLVLVCTARVPRAQTLAEAAFWDALSACLLARRAHPGGPGGHPRVAVVSAAGEQTALPLLTVPRAALTLAQYGRSIGRDEFEIETAFGGVLAP